MGLWPLTISGKPATLLERKVVRCKSWALLCLLDTVSFGDTVSHPPDCCSLFALLPDAAGSYLNCFSQRKFLPDPDTSPSQASHLATCDPEREEPPCTAWGK
jgi:hypothetical protein